MPNTGSESQAANRLARSVAILGVGNRLRGDDAVGCIVCDEIGNSPIGHRDATDPSAEAPVVHPPSSGPVRAVADLSSPSAVSSLFTSDSPLAPDVFVLDCGSTPENYIQPISDRKPTRILVLDCCSFGAKPGEWRLFSRPEIDELSYGLLSTHTLPLTLTIEMLSLETGATIELLGIQPERIEFGERLSEPVQRALPALVQFVRDWAHRSRLA
jgi:hydrogenase maturation protease